MRQAGFNEPIIQFFVENVIFDSKDASILGETLYDPFYDWVDEYKSLYKTDYKLGVKFIRKSKDGFLGLAFENGFCNKKGAIVVSRYEPDSKSETYIISFIHEVLHLLGVVHVEKWEKMNNEKLKLEGKKETFRCSRRDLMTEKEGSSQIVSKCTLDQLNLKLGTFLSKKNCLIAAPFNPNAFSVNTLLTKNLDKESPETLALDKENLFLTKSKDTEENPISKAFKPSKVSTPDFSTLDVSTAIPLPPKVISEPLVRNINLDHEVVKDAYPDVISNPRIPRCNKIISNIVGS
ncbi:hypothetical protein HMI55_000860 [Coelomomyces lativittatus]|nr:hypothetical protein HMI55_000860 [Coelomomyces lativittatus]